MVPIGRTSRAKLAITTDVAAVSSDDMRCSSLPLPYLAAVAQPGTKTTHHCLAPLRAQWRPEQGAIDKEATQC